MARYRSELDQLPATYLRSLAADIERVKAAIAGASEASIIGVGSGGSFTIASMLCGLHESYTGRVSRPATSLEMICNPNLASASPVFLVSAEGANPDIVEALLRARYYSARPLHIITNRADTPLMRCAAGLTGVTQHVFELEDKDGYLATNSLLFDASIVARSYAELDDRAARLPPSLESLALVSGDVDSWIAGAAAFVNECAKRGNLIVTYSPLLRAVAADLESKLSESALLHCQLADLRSFAHGRHLWLADRPDDSAILAITEPSLSRLWTSMSSLIPATIPTLEMPCKGSAPSDLLTGLIAEMRLIDEIADCLGRDPGRPDVAPFGRQIYYLQISDLIPSPSESFDGDDGTKANVLGAHWPVAVKRPALQRALGDFKASLGRQSFRAVVFDYDGTLCPSSRRDAPPPAAVITHLTRLLESEVIVAVATGRGGSVDEQLRACLPERLWPRVPLALYNGGWVSVVGGSMPEATGTNEFLSHVARIVNRLKGLGVPIDTVRTTHPYQVSIRFREGVQTEGMWFVVADALRQDGLDVSRLERSKHSLDILAPGVSKSRVIANIVQDFGIDPYQILTIGDQGAWPGNDCSLLEHRFSLSVDLPSRRLDRGWKLAPTQKRDVDATLWYMERMVVGASGTFRLDLATPVSVPL